MSWTMLSRMNHKAKSFVWRVCVRSCVRACVFKGALGSVLKGPYHFRLRPQLTSMLKT